MLRAVRAAHHGLNGRNTTLILKCGHVTTRTRTETGRMRRQVHCPMCEFLEKERNAVEIRRAAKRQRRAKRKQRIQLRVEAVMKKKASAKVVKKSDLKKTKTAKPKREKGARVRKGRGWYMPSFFASSDGVDNFVMGDNVVLKKVIAAFQAADNNVVFERELITALEKSGVKPVGKKTVAKLVKTVLRNLSRAGVIGKDRDRRREEKLAKKSGKTTTPVNDNGDDEDDLSEDDDEVLGAEDNEDDDTEDEDDAPPPPSKKKRVIKKATKSKK